MGAGMSIAMGQFPYLISILVDENDSSMALAIYSVGGVISPIIIKPLTNLVKNVDLNVFSTSRILALIVGLILLMVKFQRNLILNSL